MSPCELCGKQTKLVTAVIEGADLEVCMNCAKHGTIKKMPQTVALSRPLKPELPEESVVQDFSLLLRQAREKRGLTQEDFAKLLQEKESAVPKWESGALVPEVVVAKKIGKILGFSLVRIEKQESLPQQKQKSDVLTLGDMVKVRKRKN